MSAAHPDSIDTPDAVDVVVVGGGVAGCAAAVRLARAGYGVLVLERDVEYRDRVRGEGMVPWGLEAARALGVADVVLGAPGATILTSLVAFDELVAIDTARRRATDLGASVAGVPGIVAVGHPELRQALADAARSAGALVHRGVDSIDVSPGDRPSVTWSVGGNVVRTEARLVIGADGKDSLVRRRLGVDLRLTEPAMMLTGILVDDGGVWSRDEITIGVHGENQLYVFPRRDALRLYVGRMIDADPFTGPGREQRALDAFAAGNLPHAEALGQAQTIGPCATFPMTDAWTSTPYERGVVLVGDAAGWSNPVIGQGLAVAFRDAQMLTDLLVESETWDLAVLERFSAERNERMRRLRYASAMTDVLMAQGATDRARRKAEIEARVRRRPELIRALEGVHAGPWRVDEDAFEPRHLVDLAGV